MPPILRNKHPSTPSVFEPAALLREARRQKGLSERPVPQLCILDPDCDIVRRLLARGEAEPFPHWPCYHTCLHTFSLAGVETGILGGAVGAPFAVLVAEELFSCGCRLLLSLTSAGQISSEVEPPCFFVIDRALRDEGTSYHYAAASDFAEADSALVAQALKALSGAGLPAMKGATWTTDAPFRETRAAIEAARTSGVLAVEMEAAGLYAFARAAGVSVLCVAHVTNAMGQSEGDFEKGEAEGSDSALAVLAAIAAGLAGQ